MHSSSLDDASVILPGRVKIFGRKLYGDNLSKQNPSGTQAEWGAASRSGKVREIFGLARPWLRSGTKNHIDLTVKIATLPGGADDRLLSSAFCALLRLGQWSFDFLSRDRGIRFRRAAGRACAD